MLRSRLIPVLLLADDALVKTVKFQQDIYLGDPLNAVRTFNDLGVDEIIILDILASRNRSNPNFRLIEKISSECQMPLCYGGGVTSPSQVNTLVGLGVEKISINTAFFHNTNLISESADIVGSQSIVLSVDLKLKGLFGKRLSVFKHASNTFRSGSLHDFFSSVNDLPFGELLINFVDRDGTYSGLDIDTLRELYPLLSKPITVLGGASSLTDISELSSEFGPIGCAASSIFLLKGPLRAPLIQYPDIYEKQSLL